MPMRQGRFRWWLPLFCGAALAACGPTRQAPVIERAPQARPAKPAPGPSTRGQVTDTRAGFHTVKKGDTLYSIALDHGLDYRDLADWNNIDPARIKVGQQLRLTPPAGAVTTAPLKTAPAAVERRALGTSATAGSDAVKVQPQAVRVPYTDQAYSQMASIKPEPEPARQSDPPRAAGEIGWIWPASGKVLKGFNESANLKGIAIAGKLGQPVFASAPGRVIFSGTGIRGFGKLIVIKHNDTFLSVYGHNSQLLVKEGQAVTRGQKIAEMGNTDSDEVKLHFEIRRYGKPVDPMKFLPDRPA
jgi:lipoprotein NlpD